MFPIVRCWVQVVTQVSAVLLIENSLASLCSDRYDVRRKTPSPQTLPLLVCKRELVFVCVPRVVSAFDALCNTPAGHSAARSAEEEEAMVLRAIQASARLPRTWALAYVLANT